MPERCVYTPDDLDGSGLALRCGREVGHDGDHHLLAISDDGRACWLYVEDGLRPLEPTIHLDMRPGAIDDEMAMALCAIAVGLVDRADAAAEFGAKRESP